MNKARALGVLALLIGGALAYWCVWLPWQQAHAGAASISLSMKGSMIVPLALIFGLGLLVGGNRFYLAMHNDPARAQRWGKTSPLGWLLIAASLAAGGGLYYWLQQTLRGLGYFSAGTT